MVLESTGRRDEPEEPDAHRVVQDRRQARVQPQRETGGREHPHQQQPEDGSRTRRQKRSLVEPQLPVADQARHIDEHTDAVRDAEEREWNGRDASLAGAAECIQG